MTHSKAIFGMATDISVTFIILIVKSGESGVSHLVYRNFGQAIDKFPLMSGASKFGPSFCANLHVNEVEDSTSRKLLTGCLLIMEPQNHPCSTYLLAYYRPFVSFKTRSGAGIINPTGRTQQFWKTALNLKALLAPFRTTSLVC